MLSAQRLFGVNAGCSPFKLREKNYFMTECGGWVNESHSLGKKLLCMLEVWQKIVQQGVQTVAGTGVLFFWYYFDS